MRKRLLLLLGVLLALLPGGAMAIEATVRAGLHETFGRLVIEWPDPSAISAERDGELLHVRASDPLPADLDRVAAKLAPYLDSLTLDADGAGFRVKPAAGIDLSHELFDKRLLVLNFSAAPPELRLRVGQHPGFVRLVIEPLAADAVAIDRSPGTLALHLPGRLSAWALGRLREVPGITRVVAEPGVLKLGLAPRASARDQHVGPDKLVIDLAPPSDVAATTSSGPRFPAPRARPVPAAASDETVEEPAKAFDDAASEPAKPPADAGAPEPPAASPTEGPVVISGTRLGDDSLEIAFRPPAPAPAAVFVRGRSLWVILGFHADAIEIDADAFKAAAGRHVTGLRRERHDTATVLRLALADERRARVRRDGGSWVVELGATDGTVETAAAPGLETRSEGELVPEITGVVSLIDPLVGDRLGIGLALATTGPRPLEQRFVGLRLLPTAQGAAWRELAGVVTARDLTDGGLLLKPAHGVLPGLPSLAAMAPPADAPAPAPVPASVDPPRPVATERADGSEHPPDPAASSAPSPLGLAAFAEGDFRVRRRKLAATLAKATGPASEAARQDLARLLLVHGLGAETLELLEAPGIGAPSPGKEVPASAAEAALAGAAFLLMDRPAEAAERLGDPGLAADDETALWRGAALAALGEWDRGLAEWQRGSGHLADYPSDLQAALAVPGVRLLLETGRADAAFALIDRLTAPGLRSDRLRSLRRLEAVALERDGATEEALAAWQALAEAGPIEERAVARSAAASLALAAGRISLEQAIRTLEADRLDWRGQEEEFALWRRLAALEREAGRSEEALETLRAAMERPPPPAEAKRIASEMSRDFAELMGELGTGDRSATSALLLYRRYQELMPPGAPGDELAMTLSEALLATGLATAGAGVLEDRLELHPARDAARARLGLRLAGLHVASHAFDEALATLVATTPLEAVDVGLAAERQHLTAEALAARSGAGAVAAGPATARQRARTAFDAGDWPAVRLAAAPLEAALPQAGPLEATDGEIVLMLATAARQMGDVMEVQRLAQRHADRLSSESDAALLELLAGLPAFAGDTGQVLADATRHLHEARDELAALAAR